ncbi:hypothetical protein PUN4_280270 [Paraburkholderia unamae]|nr:hypothetical protein PUN4_280270 [Paraburkholderia unamae]
MRTYPGSRIGSGVHAGRRRPPCLTPSFVGTPGLAARMSRGSPCAQHGEFSYWEDQRVQGAARGARVALFSALMFVIIFDAL